MKTAIKMGASDIHLVADSQPLFRTHGKLEPYLASGIMEEKKRWK